MNGTKLKNPLNFDEEIQIDEEYLAMSRDKYTEEKITKEYNHVYRLYAIIVHEGYSTVSGHYYSYIKNQETGFWYKYDDDSVKSIGKDLSNVKSDIQYAYILFYKKQYLNYKKLTCSQPHQHQAMMADDQDSEHQFITAIQENRVPSFYRQLKSSNYNPIDYFETEDPSTSFKIQIDTSPKPA